MADSNKPQHVAAAAEIVEHSWQSVEWYLARSANKATKVPVADITKVRQALTKKVRDGGEAKLTKTDIYKMFTHDTPEKRDEISSQQALSCAHRSAERTGNCNNIQVSANPKPDRSG